MMVYACVLTVLGVDRYVTYHAGLDLGLFAQAVAGFAHGFANQPEGGSHYVVHFSPILWVAVPAVLASHSPLALTVIQAVAGSLVALPVYLMARRRMDQRLAVLCAVIALLYPPLVGVTFTDFHENGFAPCVTSCPRARIKRSWTKTQLLSTAAGEARGRLRTRGHPEEESR